MPKHLCSQVLEAAAISTSKAFRVINGTTCPQMAIKLLKHTNRTNMLELYKGDEPQKRGKLVFF